MGESIQEGKILKWVKNVGDKIDRDEVLLEISTDKVDTEVPAPNGGILVSILANVDDTVEVGKVIAVIETDASAATVSAPAPAAAVAPAPTPAVTAAPVPATIPAPVPAATPAPVPPPAAPVVSGGATTDVVMPKMGESIQEGKVLKWLKAVGDRIDRDEVLLEISTDKVDTEVPAPVGGIVAEILANVDDVVEVGKVIARISTGGSVSAAPAPVAAPAAAPMVVAPVPVAAPVAAVAPAVAPAPVIVTGGTKEIPRMSASRRFYSPLVRTIAEQENITLEELESITGTGIENRVTKNDVLAYLERRRSGAVVVAAPAQTVSAAAVAAPAPIVMPSSGVTMPAVYGDDDEVIPMDRVRQLIAEHMVRSKQISPHVTSVAEADVTMIVKMREKHKAAFEKREGFKLTLTPFFMKAIVDGVKANPMVNVSVEGKNIIRHKRVNLSFATVLDDGNLIVPVVKNADALNITGLGRSVIDLSTRARAKKLAPEEIQGGTITLTNMGAWGTLFGTPVINQPQTAIVGVYAAQKRPVVREVNGDDVIVIRTMVYVSLTYDHRVIDGALASNFLASMVKSLEKMSDATIDL